MAGLLQWRRGFGWLGTAAIAIASFAGFASGAPPVSFEREVLPLLEERCNDCHHPDESRGGLDLTRIATMIRGGDELGAAIVAGEPEKSPLIQTLTGELDPAMPKKADPLPKEEIDLLRRWIAEGAKDDTPKFSAEDVAFFEREVRPVLFGQCFKCHAGDEAESGLRLSSRYGILRGGDRGPAAVPGKPEESRIIAAVKQSGKLKMPRGGDRLSGKQIAALEEWIRRGVPWPDEERVLTREKLFTISDADRDHWAFGPLPEKLPASWSIDAVLEERQAAAGLKAAPEADRHRLLRRVTFDLIGYPPTAKEVDAFVNDDSADAFEKVIDRLLDSRHFGQRWGRHWLDYTRNGANGQSNRGPEMDPERYAKWVVNCFNEDRPWDWFARVHLAGDRMPEPEPGTDGADFSIDQALAAAVPLNGPRTFQNASTETFVLMDKLDEGIEFMGRSLMGISLECARCHDHKFDPVSHRDYYALLGFFQSSWFGPVPAEARSLAEAEARQESVRELRQEHARLRGLIRREGTKVNVGGGGLVKQWQASRQEPLAPKEKRMVELEVAILKAELKQAETDGKKGQRFLDDIRKTIAAREASLTDFEPRHFYVVAFKEMGYELHGHKTQVGLIERATDAGLKEAVEELKAIDQFWIDERARWGERQKYGGHRRTDPEVAKMVAWDDELQRADAKLKKLEADQMLVRCEGGLRRAEELDSFKKAAEDGERAFYPELVPAYIGDARLLRRGDVLEPDEIIPRGFPEFFGGGNPETGEGSGRLELANWLTEPDSIQAALVARAAVNRAWQHLFGEALCRTPKELGRLGEVPELPEVVDGLAAKFEAGGWSMKSLIREIVSSRAYRRSSVAGEKAFEVDPQNRWFARQNVRRLEAEPIMNTMAFLRHGKRFEDSKVRDAELLGSLEFFQNFDGPTTDDLIDRRTASISATQALFMMNNGSASKVIGTDLSKRLRGSENPELPEIVADLYHAILQRPPDESETAFAKEFLERRRDQQPDASHSDEIHEYIHLLLSSNELIYLE